MGNNLKIATLSNENSTKVQELETELGKHIMAYEAGNRFARLSQDEILRIVTLEKELGVMLLVYDD